MAIMIPDSCPSKASAGEKRLFRLFQDLLPDNFKVWYEPIVQGRYPDFVLLADTFGLLILEVKGWYAKDILKASDTEIELQVSESGESHVRKEAHPLRQARDYLFPLMDQLAKHEILRNTSGEHEGKLSFPCGYGVLLTNVTRKQREEHQLQDVFPDAKTICRDELSELENNQNDRETLKRLKDFFSVTFPFEPLSEDQLQTISGILHKEVVVKSKSVEGAGLPADATALQVLDHKQEQIAKSIGSGHRVFAGVAGSGKTVLLIARAKMLAEADPTKKILILCYNRVLGNYLRAGFTNPSAYRNVRIYSIHSWMREQTGLRKLPEETMDEFGNRLVESFLHQSKSWPEERKYDAILIDEGHDFAPEWFRCCAQASKGGEQGDLLIAVDGAQSLYGRPQDFTWKSVGVVATGRTKRLSSNYRNTKQILDLAWQIAQAPLPEGEESETNVRVSPTEALREGPIPRFWACNSLVEEQARIAKLIRHFKSQGIPEREIIILYPRKEGQRIEELVKFLRNTEEICWITDPDNTIARERYLTMSGARLCTIHSAKGLEFPVVILCGVDQLPTSWAEDPAQDANLLYVGMTRAMEHLVLTWTGSSAFTQRIEASPYCQRWENL